MPSAPSLPATIAVDLTPLLPGGENGGAKVFAVELVRALSHASPQTSFVLLTQASSHEELVMLDGPNVRRELVLQAGVERTRSGLAATWERTSRSLPAALVGSVSRVAYSAHRTAKRRQGMEAVRRIAPGLLFAPFTATTYRLPGVPTVSVVHDLQHRALPEYFGAAERTYRECALREAIAEATMVVAVSSFTASALLAGDASCTGRVRVIPERLGGRLPRPVQGTPLPFSLEPRAYFLYPANTWPHKNHAKLVQAFALASMRGLPASFRLVLTGSAASAEPALQRAIEASGLRDRVARAGFVEVEALARLLAGARALVFPSLYEGFGIPVIEAMAAGTPVACSNTTALPELAHDAALVFDPGSIDDIAAAMVRLGTDDSLCADLAVRGHERARDYEDPAVMARDYLRVFSEAVQA
jgi:glycosyltransferase involved in cell wall biosynthesis